LTDRVKLNALLWDSILTERWQRCMSVNLTLSSAALYSPHKNPSLGSVPI
jgi:hypothetical protein